VTFAHGELTAVWRGVRSAAWWSRPGKRTRRRTGTAPGAYFTTGRGRSTTTPLCGSGPSAGYSVGVNRTDREIQKLHLGSATVVDPCGRWSHGSRRPSCGMRGTHAYRDSSSGHGDYHEPEDSLPCHFFSPLTWASGSDLSCAYLRKWRIRRAPSFALTAARSCLQGTDVLCHVTVVRGRRPACHRTRRCAASRPGRNALDGRGGGDTRRRGRSSPRPPGWQGPRSWPAR
jgi:hypothetical protein